MNISVLLNIIFFSANTVVAIGFIAQGRMSQIANPAAASLFYLGIIILESYTWFKLKNYIRVLLIVTLTSHSLIGELLRAYYYTAWFDNSLHMFGSFTFAILSFEILTAFLRIKSSKPVMLTFVLVSLLGIAIGTLFELIEFSLDRLLSERNQFGLIDTDLDLAYDLLGSLISGIFLALKDYEPLQAIIKNRQKL